MSILSKLQRFYTLSLFIIMTKWAFRPTVLALTVQPEWDKRPAQNMCDSNKTTDHYLQILHIKIHTKKQLKYFLVEGTLILTRQSTSE